MRIERYALKDRDLWNDFIKTSKNGIFMFDRNYMDYHADRFTDHSLMIYDEDKLLALLPANEKDGALYSHQGLTFGGFVMDNKMKSAKMLEVLSCLKEYLLINNFTKLIYKAIPHTYHKQPSEEDLYALFREGAKLIRVDVSTSINLMDKIPFAELRRRGVKKADKNGVTVQQSTSYKGYMDVLAAVLEENHGTKPVHSAQEIELLTARFPENIKLFTAEKDSVILAGVLVFEYDNLVHSQYIAASAEGRDMGALDAVFAYLINELYADKKYFDFGISTESSGTYLNNGLVNQKEGFGGRAVVHNFFELRC